MPCKQLYVGSNPSVGFKKMTTDKHVDELERKIQMITNGENDHIGNKAIFYLKYARGNNNLRIVKLFKLCECALNTYDWSEVKKFLPKSYW